MTTAKNTVFIGLELEYCHQQKKPCIYIYIYIYIIYIYIIYIYMYKYIYIYYIYLYIYIIYYIYIYIACNHQITQAMQFAETSF